MAGAVWDYRGEMTMLTTFWEAAGAIDERGAAARDERTRMRFGEPEEVVELWRGAGLHDVHGGAIVVSASYENFNDLWEPFLAESARPATSQSRSNLAHKLPCGRSTAAG